MIFDHETCLLYIEPKGPISEKPVIDGYFLKLFAAFKGKTIRGVVICDFKKKSMEFVENISTMGVHTCSGGDQCQNIHSESCDMGLVTQSGRAIYTNTLALHYLAYHRSEVPVSELEKIEKLLDDVPLDQTIPSQEEIDKMTKGISPSDESDEDPNIVIL